MAVTSGLRMNDGWYAYLSYPRNARHRIMIQQEGTGKDKPPGTCRWYSPRGIFSATTCHCAEEALT